MNTDPTDTRHPHLDLGDLIAGAAGQPAGDQAREHLASCEHCQREANRWNLVAGGVRGLAAAAPEAAQPARPRRTRQRVLAGPWRRAMLVAGSAAAALILLVGVGAATGYVHVHLSFPGTSDPGTGTALTAVSGCTGLELANGTLEQVNGSSLVIKTASGRPVTVTTTAPTRVSVAGALLSDITDGASVIVLGPSSGGTIAAASVTVGPPPGGTSGKGTLRLTPPRGWVAVQGTASDASAAGFTVVTSGGTRVPVTITGATFVVVPHASLGQLRAGVTTVALGHAGPDGTLSAIGVLQQPPGSIQVHFNVAVRGCSPASITDALAAALGSGG
jgi:anti-sigma factor RsiW